MGTDAHATTGATTRTEPPRAPLGRGRRGGYAFGALSVAAGLALVAAAVPLAGSGLAEVPGNPVLQRLQDGDPGQPALRRLIRSREASLAWRETGRAAKELGLARMMLAESVPQAARARERALAEGALLRGLALAPVDSYAWMWLARVRMERLRPAGEVAPALGQALASGPNERALLRPTARAALYSWDALGDDVRRRAGRRIRAAWRADPVGTASDAAALGRSGLLAEIALASGPGGR